MLLESEGQDFVYSALLFDNRAGLSSPSLSLDVSGLERLPGLGPSVAVELARYLSLPTPPSACGSL